MTADALKRVEHDIQVGVDEGATLLADLNQHGPDAFRFSTRTKTVTSRWPSGINGGASFVIPTMHRGRRHS